MRITRNIMEKLNKLFSSNEECKRKLNKVERKLEEIEKELEEIKEELKEIKKL